MLLLAAASGRARAAESNADARWEPDVPEVGSVEAIRNETTAPDYLPGSVAYVPASASVPSPAAVLGHQIGASGYLSSVAEVEGYFRRLAAASDRVRVLEVGESEEGRPILLAVVSDAENLASLDHFAELTGRLADPRRTTRAEMEEIVVADKPAYYFLGGLHSAETGSPEMLMELAYRLAVSERPEIRRIRRDVLTFITPVVEVDGRERQVEWWKRNVRGRALSYEELREFASPPYWGHYAFHDNNRDGIQLDLALSAAVDGVFYRYHPLVLHDLHESIPLLYISTGHGPYSTAVDPVTINEWTQLAHFEAGALEAMGLPGVWTWGFWDGWSPGYLVSVANNHNGIGRFYETFGNLVPRKLERKLGDDEFAGKPVTEVAWYRPWPPAKKIEWSLRDNTNYMEAGALAALHYTALHGEDLLRDFWAKGERAVEKGRSEAPYAWIIEPDRDDPSRLTVLVDLLLRHRVEIHRLTRSWQAGATAYPAGTYVVRLDQPYRNLALTLLEKQEFPADEPNAPYDDVAWTLPLQLGLEAVEIDDRAILDQPMAPVEAAPQVDGSVTGEGGVYLLADHGQNALLAARVLLGDAHVAAAEAAFSAGGRDYPAGSWIVDAPRPEIERVAAASGLDFTAVARRPDGASHPVDLPRLGVLHTWTSTQDCGWVRFVFDREHVPYTLISPDDLRAGGLGDRFDVILFPNTWGDFARIVHGIDPRWGPLPYTSTAETPSLGIPDASPDITGGMGFAGLLELERFVVDGGVLVTLGNAGTLAVDGGLVRHVDRSSAHVNTPGSILTAKLLRPADPIVYGYPETTHVFRGNGPLFEVPDRLRSRTVVQFGTKPPEADGAPGHGGKTEAGADGKPAEKEGSREKEDEPPLLLSGYVKGGEDLDGKPAILDVPVGDGRVVLFAFDPLHRDLNRSDFRFLYNVLLNWNDLGGARAEAKPAPRRPVGAPAAAAPELGRRDPLRDQSTAPPEPNHSLSGGGSPPGR